MAKENTPNVPDNADVDSTQETGPESTSDTQNTENTNEDAALGEKGIKALREERKARKQLETKLSEALSKIEEYEDAKRSNEERLQRDADKLREQLAEANKRNEEIEHKVLAQQIAAQYGIPDMADRIQGQTREELEEDAKSFSKQIGFTARRPAPVPQAGRNLSPRVTNRDLFKQFIENNLT